jgi:hypothetical protein
MKRKTAAKGRATAGLTDAAWRKAKAAFLSPATPGEDGPTLHEFARSLHLDAGARREFLRRASVERLEEERAACDSRRWYEANGLGAETEAEFCTRFALTTYAHLVWNGAEGYALAMAFGRDVWRRCMSPLHVWESYRDLELSREAYRVLVERQRKERREADASSPWSEAVRHVA